LRETGTVVSGTEQARQAMRWFHITLIAVFVAAILVFAIQNLQIVTVSFLNFGISAPLAIVIAVIYLLGMATGGSLWSLIRWAVEGSKNADMDNRSGVARG
jgi:uncharacterized integral membrane protein